MTLSWNERNDFKRILQQKQKNILERIKLIEEDLAGKYREEPEQNWEDEAGLTQNQDVLSSLDKSERQELWRIQHALGRLEHGEYGVCEVCGDEISDKRLKALPSTTMCIDCAQSAQSERAHSA